MKYEEFPYDEMMLTSKEFMDTIDFTKFLSDKYNCISVRDLMDCIEEYYDRSHPELLPSEFNGMFFNFINEGEFTDYLTDRYGFKGRVEIIEKYYIYKE